MKKWLKRLFCSHQDKGWYRKDQMYFNLSGETQYLVCNKCGKELKTRFVRNADGS